MANINTALIDGFESMEPAEQVKALLELDIPEEVNLDNYVTKETFNKKASEAKKLSDRVKSLVDDDEQKKLAEKEAKEAADAEREQLKSENEALKKQLKVSALQGSFAELGMEPKLAAEVSSAIVEGKHDKMITGFKTFLDAYKAKIESDLMAADAKPGGGSGDANAEGPDVAFANKFNGMFGTRVHGDDAMSIIDKWHK